MLITITQTTPNPPLQFDTTDLVLKCWYSQSFVAGDGATSVQGGNGQSGFMYEIACTQDGSGNLVVPSFEIQATTESNPTANFLAQLYVNGAPNQFIIPNTPGASGWQIPTLYGDTITFAELALYNRARRLLYPDNQYLTRDESIVLFQQLAGNFDFAAVGINGIARASYAPLVASEPTFVSTTDPNYLANTAPGNVYNVFEYGIVGAAHGGSPADESVALLALLTTVYNAGGGVIQFNDRPYRFDSKWLIPNDGAATPTQPSLRITGMGASHNGQGGAPSGGTIIDLRYNGTIAKIDSRGLGLLEIDRISFVDGSASVLPFIQVTNTTPDIHHNEFYGSTANPTTQDAIILGGTSTTLGGGSNAPFQGYVGAIYRNYFNRIRRWVYVRTYGNGIVIQNNGGWTSCGGTAAIEFLGFDAGNANSGAWITGNLFELNNYTYAIKLAFTIGVNIIGNNGYDPTGTTTAMVRFESTAEYNYLFDGFHQDSIASYSDASGGTNTTLTMHQSKTSTWPQPVDFTNVLNRFVNTNGVGPTIQRSGANDLFDLAMATSTLLYIRYTPSGGSVEEVALFQRASATDKRIQLQGSTNNIFSSVSDTRVQAASGFVLFLGTATVANVLELRAAGTTTALPITSSLATGTAPFTIASTTKVSNLNVDKLDGQDFADPGAIGGGTPAAGTFTTLRANSVLVRGQATPSTPTTAATLTVVNLLIGILTATPTATGATVVYTLPTGTDMSGGATFANNDSFDWSITNLAAASADTITLTANTDHTIVGNPIVQSANAATGGIYGNAAMFRSRKISATVWVTYRIS